MDCPKKKAEDWEPKKLNYHFHFTKTYKMHNEEIDYTKKDSDDVTYLLKYGAIALVLTGAIAFWCTFKDEGYEKWGTFVGGVIGTIFSLAGVVLLFLTLKEQRDAFRKERFETRLFEMIKIYRENVAEIEFRVKKNMKDEEVYASRKFFSELFKEFSTFLDEVGFLFEDATVIDIYQNGYLETLKKNKTIVSRGIDLKKLATIDILYLCLFFGVGRDSNENLKNHTIGKYNETFVNTIIKWIRLKPKRDSDYWEKWNSFNKYNKEKKSKVFQYYKDTTDPRATNDELFNDPNFDNAKGLFPGKFEKYYGGHQFRLGHYYRHLYQTVKLINSNPYLDYKEKYENNKFLRGQLSTYEQVLLFLNSLSSIGRIWELENKKNPEQEIGLNYQLITKYNLIKNLPSNEIIPGIKVSDFYPEVNYEFRYENQSSLDRRAELESKYN